MMKISNLANTPAAVGMSNSALPTGAGSGAAPSILKATKSGHSDVHNYSMSDYADFGILTAAAAAAGGYDTGSNTPTSAKRRKQDPKTGKGLRHFSMKVTLSFSCFRHCFIIVLNVSSFVSSLGLREGEAEGYHHLQ